MFDILSYVKGFFELIGGVVDFVISFFQDTVNAVQLLARAASDLPDYLSFVLPPQLLGVFVLIIPIVVLYKVLGRD